MAMYVDGLRKTGSPGRRTRLDRLGAILKRHTDRVSRMLETDILMNFLCRWALNRADLILGSLVLIWMIVAAVIAISSTQVWERLLGPGSDEKLIAAILTGWITIFLAGIGGAVKITSTRPARSASSSCACG
jgi:hypothetical protein